MAYYTGTVNSMADLLTAFRSACTSNGYTLSGNVLHKGTLYAEVRLGNIGDAGAPTNTMMCVKAGNGIDGSNNLTDAAPAFCMAGPLMSSALDNTWPDWDWPINYHIHINTNPDEVWLVMNYDAGTRFQHIAFGRSPSPGNQGTGNWSHGFRSEGAWSNGNSTGTRKDVSGAGISPDGQNGGGSTSGHAGVGSPPFWWGAARSLASSVNECRLNAFIHGGIHGTTGLPIWSDSDIPFTTVNPVYDPTQSRVSAGAMARPLLARQPNGGNGYGHLIRIKVYQSFDSDKSVKVGELEHVRVCRNDFIDNGQVIGAGASRFKVYPAYMKNLAARNGGTLINHSGTVAVAIRYDGI